MSFKALAWAYEQELRNPVKAVLCALAYRDNHDEPHGCFPSVARVAKDCGLSRSAVVRCLRKLVATGLVHREPRRDPHGDKTTSFYTFPQVWVGADGTYPGSDGTEGRRGQHLPVGAHGTIEPRGLTGIERGSRAHEPRAPHLLDEEKQRRARERDERLRRQHEVQRELFVGSSPELPYRRPPEMTPQEIADGLRELRAPKEKRTA